MTEPDPRITEALRSTSPMLRCFLMEHGRLQQAQPVAPGWVHRRMRKPGGCYVAAGRWAAREPSVTYTEGVAVPAEATMGAFAHAWLTDAAGGVIDLAWREPGQLYVGVQIPQSVLTGVVAETGKWGPRLLGLIGSGWTPVAAPR
jgi:hypothetical protein